MESLPIFEQEDK